MSGGMDVVTSPACTPCGEPLTAFYHNSPDHCMSSMAAINRMRQNAQLCDVTLRVNGAAIVAHRVVLASVSPYFHAMFNDDLAEKQQPEVTLHGVDASALTTLVEYSYTGEVTITEDNVQVLLPASSLLQMQSVREACCKFLIRQLHPSNCLGIRSFAHAHDCTELQGRAHRFALHHFQDVVATEEFLILPVSDVEELISHTQLNTASEEQVFMAVATWVRHDLATREPHVARLLRHVRLPLMSRDFLLSHVDADALVRDNAECRELLLEAMKYHLLPEQRPALANERTAHRRPEGLKPYLFAIGGGSLFAIHSECEVYNPRSERWTPIAPMLYRRSRSGVAGLGKLLYVVGGYDGAADLASAECYDHLLNKWSPLTPMGTKRSCLGICTYEGLIYVCGGYDGASCLSSMERFDPLTGVWSSCPAMNTRRRYCRIAVVENSIYALGGFDSANYQSSVERWDPRTSGWTSVPSMTSRRSSCGVAALDGMLYCVGGNDGTMCMSSGERFNLRRNAWEPIAAMHSRRSTHEVAAMGARLYALGGTDGCSSLNTVETYQPNPNSWTLATPMTLNRICFGAAALESTHEVVEISRVLFALGGNDGSSSLNSVETYDGTTNKWTLAASMLTRRSSVGAAVLECLNVEKLVQAAKP